MIKFVENKFPNMDRVSALLDQCYAANQWANRGPLYDQLAADYTRHFALPHTNCVTPCANAGIALEAMSRLLGQTKGRPIRWVGSAYSFQNLGRGHFADMCFLDCNEVGLLDLDAVKELEPESFDGIIVVNPFGIFRDLTAYIDFANETGKLLLFDNAAGVDMQIPDWPWQAFSLHHTKPYGTGEGGLAITPAPQADALYALLNYGPAPENAADWLNNGKISDISCAFLIDRLETVETWYPAYIIQARRVSAVAKSLGFAPLCPFDDSPPATSLPFLHTKPISLDRVLSGKTIMFGKYYKPLAPLPRTSDIYARLINIPTHPDLAEISDDALFEAVSAMLI